MTLTKEASLTAATLTYTCACIAEGDLMTLSRMGLERDDIEILKQLSLGDIPRLSAMESHFLSISIDRHCLSRLLAHIRQQRSDLIQRDELIKSDAPLAMIRSLYYETSPTDYCKLRKLFDLEGVGRTPEPEEQDELTVWTAYSQLHKSLEEITAGEWLQLHEETEVSLRVLWLLIRRWSDNPQQADLLDDDMDETDQSEQTHERQGTSVKSATKSSSLHS